MINLSGPIRDESLTPDRVTTWRRATRSQHHILGGNLPKPVSYGANIVDAWAGSYAGQILKGAKPADGQVMLLPETP